MFLILLTPASSQACYVPPDHLTVHYSELVQRTARIILAKVSQAEKLSDNKERYHFVPIEILKGNVDKSFTMEFTHFPHLDPESEDSDFNGHQQGENSGPRQINDMDCQMHPFFRLGARHLIFLDKPYHWMSFEKIVSKDDRWLQIVRKAIADQLKTP